MPARKTEKLTVEGRTITISNPEKVLYPAANFTKAHVIDYYVRVAPYILPHLKDRPVTLKRYPDGVTGEHFYEKDAPGYTPAWVPTFPVPRRNGGADIRYILLNDLPTLVWSANLANLEIHPFLHCVPHIDTPTSVVFDLDPGEGTGVLDCARVAFLLRDLLDRLGLRAFPKVSGSKGLQVYVPLNSDTGYDVTQPFARTVAELLAAGHPETVISEMAKVARKGRVFIDWSQNSDFKTTVGVYSLRAKRSHPYVSLPVTWDELHAAEEADDEARLYFDPEAALARLERTGDLFAQVLTLRQNLPAQVVASVQAGERAAKPARNALAAYGAKRKFAKTPEPPAAPPRRSHQGGRRRFVVQKHAASHLHYDFRLEMHGVLKSWAVPKGVPFKRDEVRLAMSTEDHPLDYLEFEGAIPKGQYGGGTVMVWDIGNYELIEGNYYKGMLRLFLEGRKLHGEWLLARDEAGGNDWRLTRHGAAMKPPKDAEVSALTGRTMEQIAASAEDVPELATLPASPLEFVEPMRAKLAPSLPEGGAWQYEIKLDGYRALAIKSRGETTLYSRSRNPLNGRFPEIAKAFDAIEDGAIVDGEIVALDDRGRPSFNLLQNYQSAAGPIYFYAFDLLAYRGRDTMRLPLTERRRLLEKNALRGAADPLRLSETLPGPAADLVAAARDQGLEGVVAKRASSIYEPGERSGAWVKYKTNQSQELVIGGYMPGKLGFDSLLVGYYEGKKLMFNAKVKNGFTPAMKKAVMERFRGLETDRCPFANLPEPRNARRGEALTAEVMRKCRWLKPKLVAQVEYTDWTAANHLRHSRFAGLRDDKAAREVVREAA